MVILLGNNLIAITLAFHISFLLRFGNAVSFGPKQYSTFLFVIIYTLTILYFYRFFNRYIYIEKLKLVFNIIKLWLTSAVFYLLIAFLTKYSFLIESRTFLIMYFAFLLFFMLLFHLCIIPYLLRVYYAPSDRKVICKYLGPDKYKKDFHKFIYAHPLLGLCLSSSVSENCREKDINEYFLISRAKNLSILYNDIKRNLRGSKPLHVVSKLFDELNLKWEWTRFNDLPIYTFAKRDNTHFRKIIRRLMDIIGAVLFLILLAPFLVIIALAVKLGSRGPVIYKQKRCSCNGHEFTFYKFRSMVDSRNKEAKRELEFKDYLEIKTDKGKIINNDEVTQVGAILRKTSLDELPQLWNVLRGDMSLVGPRPPINYEVKYYKGWHKDRLLIKPGLTGLWQVYGRGNMPCDHSIFLDLMYVINRSLSLDIKLIFQTIPAVILGKGAY